MDKRITSTERIFYCHGFASRYEPEKAKIRALAGWRPVHGISLDYTHAPERIAAHFAAEIRPRDLLIGTSLGGYWAARMSQLLGNPFVAINPAIQPQQSLRKYLGPGKTHFGEDYHMEPSIPAAYADMPLTGQGIVALDAKDEVLCADATRRFVGAHLPVWLWPGGSHRFDHMADLVRLLRAFDIPDAADTVSRADALAQAAHDGQLRKDGATPYIQHPRAVAQLIRQAGGDPAEITAALLHDVVEDTPLDLTTIRHSFGAEIVALVDALTDPPDLAALPRRARKQAQARKIMTASGSARRIKLADQIANLQDLAADPTVWDAAAAREYVELTALVAEACRDVAGALWPTYDAALAAATNALKMHAPPAHDG